MFYIRVTCTFLVDFVGYEDNIIRSRQTFVLVKYYLGMIYSLYFPIIIQWLCAPNLQHQR